MEERLKTVKLLKRKEGRKEDYPMIVQPMTGSWRREELTFPLGEEDKDRAEKIQIHLQK